jgi:hypothetical protein
MEYWGTGVNGVLEYNKLLKILRSPFDKLRANGMQLKSWKISVRADSVEARKCLFGSGNDQILETVLSHHSATPILLNLETL